MSKGIMNVYGCGGTGINIAKHVAARSTEFDSDAFAEREIYYIDTSVSNLGSFSRNDPNVYTYDGVDGAGKNRKHVGEVVMEHVNDVLLKFKPADINIVIASNSGGSGGVIAASLMSELLARDESVILLAVNSYEDKSAVSNVEKSMKSYESISRLRRRPIVAGIFENGDESEVAVNKRVSDTVVMLAALFSKNNEGMDTQDLRNWLNYDKVTDFEPGFVSLLVQIGEVRRSKEHHLIASAVLAADRELHKSYGFVVGYQKVGYFNVTNAVGMLSKEPVNYLIYDGLIDNMFKKLTTLVKELDEESRARTSKRSFLNGSEKIEGNGVML